MARQSKMMMLSGKIIFWTNISSWLTYKTSSNGTGGKLGITSSTLLDIQRRKKF